MTGTEAVPPGHALRDLAVRMEENSSVDEMMFTIKWPKGKPSLAEAANALHVKESDLDAAFGVVLIDPDRNEYTVLCRGPACASVRPSEPMVEGPYANPGIGTFGPPRSR